MKASIHTRYGSPEVLTIQEISKPIPSKNELLIKVFATTVNRTDCGFRSAEYVISRLYSGLFKPKNQVLGNEFAGIIENIGESVTRFKVGDKVFGYNDQTFGAHAEYLSIPENTPMSTIPIGLTFYEAAPILEGAHYAWCDIVAAKIKAGDRVCVYGATGSIGSAAVQLLKHLGTHVTAVCSTNYIDTVLNLGADIVIDYHKQDFTKTPEPYDFIFDAVGKSSFGACKLNMKQKGIYISTELGKGGENIFLALLTPLFGGKKVLFPIPSIDNKMVSFLKELVENGKFKPLIDRYYNLDDIVEATKYVESGQKIGNVIIKVRS